MKRSPRLFTRLWLASAATGLLSLGLTVQAQNTITNSLVAYWDFDDNFNDSFQHFDGTANGGKPIVFVSGKSGFSQAIQLDGVDQFVQITGGNADDLAFVNGSVSIAGWFKVEAFDKDWQALVAQGEGSSWRVARNGANPTMSYAGGLADAVGVTNVNDGNWHHFVAISDAEGANFGSALYIDGVQDAMVGGVALLAGNSARTMIGNNPGSTGRSWHGEIDDVAIWSRVLTEAEISTLYAGGAGKPLSAFLPAGQDTDKDGMPDAWEIKYGFNPNDASDATKDANGNGISNLDEFLRGLDPLDTTKPTIASVAGNTTFDKVIITFSKPLDVTTATNLANYAISPSLAISNAAVQNNVVTLSTAKQPPGATAYVVTVNNVKDVNNWMIATNSQATFYSYVLVKTGINTGLKAYWNFDGDLKDTVGIFDGTENGSSPIPFIDGKTGFGKAIQLDGIDQYVVISGGNPDDLAFAGGSLSIAGWFKVEAFDKDWQALVAQGEGTSWRVARNAANNTMSYAGGLGDGTGVTNVNDGNWHHFVAISDSTGNAFGSALYIDGARDATVAGKAVLATNGQRTMIGNNPGSTARSWNGEIDDVAIWNRIVSEAEIASLYNGGTGKPLSALASTSVDIPTPPEGIFTAQTPAPNAKNVLPTTTITFVHTDGKIVWSATNVTLKLNGATVTPTFARNGNDLTITYKPTAILASASVNTIALGVLDPGGNPTTLEWSFTVSSYPTLTTAQQAVSVDKTKPGFLWRVFQNEAVATTTVASTEEALAGLLKAADGSPLPNLADPAAVGVAVGPGTTVGGLVQFEIPTVINVSRNGTDAAGNWIPDEVMPGIPGTSGGTDGIDAEIITFVDLPAGAITMGVNSDDGFRSQAAYINKPADGLFLGQFDAGRGAADTTFTFVVQDAGIYPIRTIYQNGTGGANIEIFTVKADGSKVLLNDSTNGGYLTYRSGVAPNKPTAILPAELGQTLNGFQDDFTGTARDTNWVAVGPGGDHYVQADGVLKAFASTGDPNHLLYMAPGASNSVEEVLARLRIVNFGSGDPARGGIAVNVYTNVTGHLSDWIGMNLNIRNNSENFNNGPTTAVHFKLLDDLRGWGPQTSYGWTNNIWYWLRLKMDPSKPDGTNIVYAKTWLADGTTAEPANWDLLWSSPPTPLHGGYAGITGCSGGGLGQFEVDYILIKAASLPSITVNFAATTPATTKPFFASIVSNGGTNVVANWFGAGALQTAPTVVGPWTNQTNKPPATIPLTGTNAVPMEFLRIQQ